jgi:toxin ParE1/3/4
MTPPNPPVRKRPAAQRDLLDHFVDLGERAGEATALRFLQAAEDTFADLAAMPGMGRAEDFDNPRLTGMRRWRVRGFDNYLIFYQPLSQGIEVLRVVYGTRDLLGLFPSELGET